ncbi:nuclear transport factor 2 family protein (plasmid) [Pantoea sp. C3]|uniref:nuclear transport factor 2 family protein n=1 Tax=Pantoea phytostimulans TaxID=2769024 RepID=UPI0038F5EA2A
MDFALPSLPGLLAALDSWLSLLLKRIRLIQLACFLNGGIISTITQRAQIMTDAINVENEQRYVDELKIQRLLAIYIHNLDDGKFTENSELLKHAEFTVLRDTAHGREEVEQFFIRGVQRHEDGTPRTWHSVSSALIDISPSGDSATCVSYFTVHQELEGFPLQPICTGRYYDTFEKHDGYWRFTSRNVVPRLMGDLQFHVGAPVNRAQME